jgi:hypothetical protein
MALARNLRRLRLRAGLTQGSSPSGSASHITQSKHGREASAHTHGMALQAGRSARLLHPRPAPGRERRAEEEVAAGPPYDQSPVKNRNGRQGPMRGDHPPLIAASVMAPTVCAT